MDRGTLRNMQSFIPKINLEKLVHLVGTVIRIYHDARSPESQIVVICSSKISFRFEIYCTRRKRDSILEICSKWSSSHDVDCLTLKTKLCATAYTVVGEWQHLSPCFFFEVMSYARFSPEGYSC